MWNLFKKKADLPSPGAPSPNRVNALANTLQREGHIDRLEWELQTLDTSQLTEAKLESRWHLYGIALFRAGRQQVATALFEEAHRRFPGSARIRFSLGQQYVSSRQIDRGFALFRLCAFPEVPQEVVLAQVRYANLWNRYEDGRRMLRPFLKVYQDLKILDDHYLYVRGLPFFGQWRSHLAALSTLSREPQELENATGDICRHCKDYDCETLNAELARYRDGQPQVMLPLVEERLEGPGLISHMDTYP